jgi:hypothetical protein
MLDGIYSSVDSTRHLEKVQEQEIMTDKEAANTALFFLKRNSTAL